MFMRSKGTRAVMVGVALSMSSLFAPISGFADGDKGIGPVSEVKLGASIDSKLADQGKVAFEGKCSACHKWEEKYVGPALKGVTSRRTPEWIMNMILNPQEMTQKDPVAKDLFEQALIQMTFQNVTQDETRAILEYFRKLDATPTK